MDHPRRALVTGGAGFIGSELVRRLLENVPEVIVADNLATGKPENLDGLPADRVRLEKADVRDGDRMADLMRGVQVVFHLACLGVRHSIHSPEESHDVNATGTLRLLLAARKCAVERFVHVSTSEVYGFALSKPISEKHPTFPATAYGASKLAGESLARAFHRTYGMESVVVRPFNVYGPRCHHEGDSGEVIPKFMLRCLAGRPMVIFGNGEQTWDFTFISDSVRGIIAAGLSDITVGMTINLGSGKEVSVNDLAWKVAGATGVKNPAIMNRPPRPGDVSGLVADCRLAQTLLGFQPEVSLEQGLAGLKDWYLSLGRSPEQLLEEEVEINWVQKNGAADV